MIPRWLRSARLWATASVLFIIVLLLLPSTGQSRGHWGDALWNLLHLPAFFLVTRSLIVLLSPITPLSRRLIVASGGALTIAVVTEVIQNSIGRSGSLQDLALNGIGITLAAASVGLSGRWTSSSISGYLLLVGAAVLGTLWPALGVEQAKKEHRKHFPDIGAFESPATEKLWTVQSAATFQIREDSLHAILGPGYGALSYSPGQIDWSGFTSICLEFSNPGEGFLLGIRLDDPDSRPGQNHSWHSTRVKVNKGNPLVRIPLQDASREIDLSRITRMTLFVWNDPAKREFSLRSALLE